MTKLIKGVMEGDRFIMHSIAGNAVQGTYKADGLRSLGRLVKGTDPVTLTIDKENKLYIPVELNEAVSNELFRIADELDKQ